MKAIQSRRLGGLGHYIPTIPMEQAWTAAELDDRDIEKVVMVVIQPQRHTSIEIKKSNSQLLRTINEPLMVVDEQLPLGLDPQCSIIRS